MSAIDHNKRRAIQHLRMILDACEGSTKTTGDMLERFELIKNFAATALVYLDNPPIEREEVGEWVDTTTNVHLSRGLRCELNTVTGIVRTFATSFEGPK